jgi:hypothetical protein
MQIIVAFVHLGAKAVMHSKGHGIHGIEEKALGLIREAFKKEEGAHGHGQDHKTHHSEHLEIETADGMRENSESVQAASFRDWRLYWRKARTLSAGIQPFKSFSISAVIASGFTVGA